MRSATARRIRSLPATFMVRSRPLAAITKDGGIFTVAAIPKCLPGKAQGGLHPAKVRGLTQKPNHHHKKNCVHAQREYKENRGAFTLEEGHKTAILRFGFASAVALEQLRAWSEYAVGAYPVRCRGNRPPVTKLCRARDTPMG